MTRSRVITLGPLRHLIVPANTCIAAPTGSWTHAAGVLSTMCLALAVFVLEQRSAFHEILSFSRSVRPGPDAWLFPAALVSTSLLTMGPALLLSSLLVALGRRQAGRCVFIALSALATAFSVLDAELLRSIGRHLDELVVVALEPQGHVAGGNVWGWVALVVRTAAMSVAGTVLVTLLCERFIVAVSRRLTTFLRATLTVGAVLGALMLVAMPHLLLQAWGAHPLVERLYASAPVDVRPEQDAFERDPISDPRVGNLFLRLRSAYKGAFAAITTGKPGDVTPLALRPNPSNVILIVTESFRHDAFVPELMPRLTRWAGRGVVATQHDAGTIYSQSGAFALLYGRSPATFHQTLDAQVPPTFCTLLRSSGYECAYFTGHPKVWLRREEFLNERTMDHFVHDDRDSWPDWDRRALDGMVEMANSSTKPIFAVVLLMSSHFEYRYPPRYEVDWPVSNTAWKVTMVSALGPEAEIPHRNRYRNCMRFIDDLVGDAIDRLDPEKNLVVFTGDHGESINDDGHYTHGYSFADVETRTPLAMVGPGVMPTRLDVPTLHVDVLPTVLHALTGARPQLTNVHGVDWLANERRRSVLEAHSPTREKVEAQLRTSGRRLRLDLDLSRPRVTFLGFEDELGRLLPIPELTEEEINELASAFEDELSVLRR